MGTRKSRNSLLRLISVAALSTLTLLMSQPDLALGESKSADTAELQKCVKEQNKLDILFLVDVSASLSKLDGKPGSDPNALRVQALRAITQLLGTTSGLGEVSASSRKEINLAFLDFGQKVRYSFPKLQGWQSLQNVLEADNKNRIFDQYKWKKTDSDTDYVRALDPSGFRTKKPLSGETGVLQVLNKSSSPCRALMWFTDGKFDIDPGNHSVPWMKSGTVYGYSQARSAVSEGKEYLCEEDPRHGKALVDVLRSSKLDATSPALFVGAIGLGKKETDFDLLRGVAEGTNACGKTPASGQFVRASNPQDLLDALSNILLTVTRPTPTVCGSNPSGDESFYLGQALQKVSLVISGKLLETDVSLVGPNSKTIPLVRKDGGYVVTKADAEDLDGIRIVEAKKLFTVSNVSYLMVTAELNPNVSGWSGEWGVEFCRDNKNNNVNDKVSVYVYGSLDLVVPTKQLTVDRTKQIVLQIVGKGAQTYSDASQNLKFKNLTVLIDGKNAIPKIEGQGVISIDYSPSENKVGQSVKVEVSTEPTFVIAGDTEIPLDFPRWTAELPVRAVPRTPYLEQESRWTPLDKNNPKSSAKFVVHPGDENGQICIKIPRNPSLPVGIGNKDSKPLRIDLVPNNNCFEMKANSADKGFELRLFAEDEKTFRIDANSPLEFPLEFKASTETGESDTGSLKQGVVVVSSGIVETNWLKAIALALGSLLFPLAILYGFNFLVASRLIIPNRYYTTRVRLSSTPVQEISDLGAVQEFSYNPDTARTNKTGLRAKSFKVDNLIIIGRLALSPFGAPSAVASHELDVVIGPSGRSKASSSNYSVDSVGRAPVSLANSWFVVLDSKSIDSSKADARIFVFAENHQLLEKTARELLKNIRDYVEVPLGEIRSSEEFLAIQKNEAVTKDSGQALISDVVDVKPPPLVSDGDVVIATPTATTTSEDSGWKSVWSSMTRFRRNSDVEKVESTQFIPRDNGNTGSGNPKPPPTL